MNDSPKNKSLPNFKQIKIKLSGKIVNPGRDWKILLILLVVLILALASFDVYVYLQIVRGDMYVKVQKSEIVVENLKTDVLQNIANTFENKKATINKLKIQHLTDPSI